MAGAVVAFLIPSSSPLWLDCCGLVGSLVVLAFSGDQFIVALSSIAGSVRLRPTVAAALVGGCGTSIAELIVAGVAAARSPALATGSLVGSIAANVCLALAVAALIAPLRIDSITVRREAPVSVAAVLVFAALDAGGVSTAKGAIMVVSLAVAVGTLLLRRSRPNGDTLNAQIAEFTGPEVRSVPREWVRAVVMIALMFGGAELIVTSSLGVAKHLGFSAGLAGLTLVGIGTSAPLIAASVQAARKGEHDLVVGNVLGGNMFIALGGGAIVALLAARHGSGVGAVSLVLMSVVVVASWLTMARGTRLGRAEAIALLVAYAACLPFINR